MSQQSNADLRRYYRVANRKYFKGKLPDIPVRFAKFDPGLLGITNVVTFKGKTVATSIEITEDIRYIQTTTIMTLLHEMTHVEKPQYKGHGWQWERQMMRLARAGAFGGLW